MLDLCAVGACAPLGSGVRGVRFDTLVREGVHRVPVANEQVAPPRALDQLDLLEHLAGDCKFEESRRWGGFAEGSKTAASSTSNCIAGGSRRTTEESSSPARGTTIEPYAKRDAEAESRPAANVSW